MSKPTTSSTLARPLLTAVPIARGRKPSVVDSSTDVERKAPPPYLRLPWHGSNAVWDERAEKNPGQVGGWTLVGGHVVPAGAAKGCGEARETCQPAVFSRGGWAEHVERFFQWGSYV